MRILVSALFVSVLLNVVQLYDSVNSRYFDEMARLQHYIRNNKQQHFVSIYQIEQENEKCKN